MLVKNYIKLNLLTTKAKELVAFLRELAPVLIKDDYAELSVLLRIEPFKNAEEDARIEWGLCFMVEEYFSYTTNSEQYVSIFGLVNKELYNFSYDPFKQFGYSYSDRVINWPFRGEKALEIANHLEEVLKEIK